MNRKEFIKGIGLVAGAATFGSRAKAACPAPCDCGTGGGAAGTLPGRVLGTTKQAHLYENLHTLDFTLSAGDIAELERAVEAIPVIGDRYDAEQQKRVLG